MLRSNFLIEKKFFPKLLGGLKPPPAPPAPRSLQDMNDIDVCVVSETHLRPDVPDAVIVMSNYALFRRDRNWNGTDMSRNGGIAIYNLRSKFFEDIIRKYSHFNDFDDNFKIIFLLTMLILLFEYHVLMWEY